MPALLLEAPPRDRELVSAVLDDLNVRSYRLPQNDGKAGVWNTAVAAPSLCSGLGKRLWVLPLVRVGVLGGHRCGPRAARCHSKFGQLLSSCLHQPAISAMQSYW